MKKYILTLILSLLFINSFSINPIGNFIANKSETGSTTMQNVSSFGNKIQNAHIFSFEYGRVISKFDYKNSDGERLANLQGSINNHLAIGWKMHFKTSKLYMLSGISYNKYGAKGSDQTLGNYYDWDVNYLGVNLGLGYEFLKTKSDFNFPYISSNPGITFNIQLSVASDFLVKGTQTINNMVYDIVGVEQFDKPFIFVYGGCGVTYYATKQISVNLEYTGGKSFSVFKSNSGDNESLNYITHIISLGVFISLPI